MVSVGNINEILPMVVIMVKRKENIMEDKELFQRQAARDILSMIEEICFSKKWIDYRVNYGSNGQRDYIIHYIKRKYNVG